jgi:hypothetical protein
VLRHAYLTMQRAAQYMEGVILGKRVWGVLLKRQGSVLRAGWPAAAEPDFIMQRAAQYIEGEWNCACWLPCRVGMHLCVHGCSDRHLLLLQTSSCQGAS